MGVGVDGVSTLPDGEGEMLSLGERESRSATSIGMESLTKEMKGLAVVIYRRRSPRGNCGRRRKKREGRIGSRSKWPHSLFL